MKGTTMRFALLAAILLTSCGGGAPAEPTAPEMIFPSLIGGAVVDPKEWPVSVFGTSGNAGCSGTVIGERVYISAAHCMRNGGVVSFSVGPHKYAATCTHHPEYRGNSTADWSICLVDSKVEGGPYEVLNTSEEVPADGEYVTLTGYGCQKWGGPIDGKLRYGDSPVVALPHGKNYDIVTTGKAALCSGDSGGALYKRQPDGARVLLAVNSRSNTTTTSYMPAVSLPTAQKFFVDWASSKGVRICGVHADAKNCRGVTPPLPESFSIDHRVAKVDVKVKAQYLPFLETLRAKLTQLLDAVH
jgi:hypothetical protein